MSHISSLAMRMVNLLAVQPKKVFAVVVAIRRANYRMNVVARRLVDVQRDSALMVELDEDDRAVNPIVENALLVRAAHPREVGLRKVFLNLCHLDLGMALWHSIDIRANQVEHEGLLAAC